MAIFIISVPGQQQVWVSARDLRQAQIKHSLVAGFFPSQDDVRELAATLRQKAVVEINHFGRDPKTGLNRGKIFLPARGKEGILELLRLRFPSVWVSPSAPSSSIWSIFWNNANAAISGNGMIAWWTAEAYLKLIKAKPLQELAVKGEV